MEYNAKIKKAVIIGSGIAGLTTALFLERMGISVVIYERHTKIRHTGGGLGIWPNGSRILHKLFGHDISQLSGQLDLITVATPTEKNLTTTPTSIFQDIASFPNLFVCRSDLHKKLLQNLSSTPVIYGKCFKHVQQNHQTMTLTFNEGEKIECDLLIAADGINSSIRNQLFYSQLNYTGYIILGGIIPNNKLPKDFSNVTIAPQRQQLLFPVANNRHYHFVVQPYPLNKLPEIGNNKNKHLQLFKGWSVVVDNVLESLRETIINDSAHYFCLPAYDMPLLPKFHQNRIVLVGDAAHPIGPILGLGTSLALCDAECLVQSLQEMSNIDDALELYSQQQVVLANNMLRAEEQEKKTLLTETKEDFYLRTIKMQTTPADQAWKPFIEAFLLEPAV